VREILEALLKEAAHYLTCALLLLAAFAMLRG
jgi:hypothetical protein